MTSWAAAASGRADAEASSGAMKVPPGFLVEGDVVEEDDVDADDDFAKQYVSCSGHRAGSWSLR